MSSMRQSMALPPTHQPTATKVRGWTARSVSSHWVSMSDILPDLGAFVEGLPNARQSGIYFLHIGDTIVYVGQAIDVRKRIGNHLSEGVKEFDRFSWLPFPVDRLDIVEREFIGRFAPRYNRCQLAITARDMKVLGWEAAGEDLGFARKMPVDSAARFLGITPGDLEALGENGPPHTYMRRGPSRTKQKAYTLNDLKDYAARSKAA